MKDLFLLQPLQPKIRFRVVLFRRALTTTVGHQRRILHPKPPKFEYFACFTENSVILGFFFLAQPLRVGELLSFVKDVVKVSRSMKRSLFEMRLRLQRP